MKIPGKREEEGRRDRGQNGTASQEQRLGRLGMGRGRRRDGVGFRSERLGTPLTPSSFRLS